MVLCKGQTAQRGELKANLLLAPLHTQIYTHLHPHPHLSIASAHKLRLCLCECATRKPVFGPLIGLHVK